MHTPHSHPLFASGFFIPAAPQLNPPPPPAATALTSAAGALAPAGLGSSHAMHTSFANGLFVEQMSHVHTSADGFGGGAIPADAQLNA